MFVHLKSIVLPAMDTLTHIALGACIGEAFLGKKIGRKAMLWGALAQSAPDVDFIGAFWLNTTENLLGHRGFTHSILFAAAAAALLALIADRVHRPHDIRTRTWFLFFGVEVFGHIFIDAFNNYGVGWFEPFSHHRFSFNAIYVADPFFSIWPGIACVALIFLRRNSNARKIWWKFGTGLCSIYLLYCLFNKIKITREIEEIVAKQGIPHQRYFTTPAPLQNWLWYVVSGNDSGYYVGYRSVFDSRKQMDFHFFPSNRYLLETDSLRHDPDLQRLKRFAQEFYTVEKWSDTLVFNDLRFGQEVGWLDPAGKFAFHYYLNLPGDNTLVVQRGRFAGWNSAAFKSMGQRIAGN